MHNIKNTHTLKKLNKSFDFLVNNPYSSFYKDKYKKAGIKFKSIKTIEQFNSLPYLTKDELLRLSPYDFVFLPLNKINHVVTTSGTTNQNNPLMLLMNAKSRPRWNNHERWKPFLDLKIKNHMLLYPGSSAAHRLAVNFSAVDKGIVNLIGDISNLSLSAKLARRIGLDSIETTASILYLFIPYLKKEYDLRKIKIVYLGGEYTSEQKYKYLQKKFKNAKFIFDFGSVETGGIAIGCEHLLKKGPRFLHPLNFVYLETFNHKEEGELVVTGIEVGRSPYLLRYRTGNHVKLTNYNCPCGEKQLIEVFGKIGHDVISVQGTFIYSDHVHGLLSSYSNYLQTGDFRLHVYEVIKNNKIMTRLVLQLILKKDIKNKEIIKKQILDSLSSKLFLTAKNTLADLVEKQIYLPLEIEFVESFPFAPKQTSIVSHII
jgi:phenylacetate-CoA ligase